MSEPLKKFHELVDLPPDERIKHELKILEGLMGAAVQKQDWTAALKIFESSHEILKRHLPKKPV